MGIGQFSLSESAGTGGMMHIRLSLFVFFDQRETNNDQQIIQH
jgi:hypothetical protein